MKKTLLTIGLAFAAAFNVLAGDYRLFWLVREADGTLHGKRADDPRAPYEQTITAPSRAAAKRLVLHEIPNAIFVD